MNQLDEIASDVRKRVVAAVKSRIYPRFRSSVDDVVQDTMEKLISDPGLLEFQAESLSWQDRVIQNKVIDQLRKLPATYQNVPLAIDLESQETDVVSELIRTERLNWVERALAKLTPKDRELFEDRLLRGCTFTEISERQDGRPETIRIRFYKILRQIRDEADNVGLS